MTVLVTCASKHGATTEIAEALGRELDAHGLDVDVVPADEVGGVERYDAVVLGSAVYMGNWLAPALALAEANEQALRGRPTWLFSSGPLGDPPQPDPPDLAPLAERVGARGHRVFTGRLDRGRLSLGERAVVRMVKAPYGDFRDWEAVADLADEIAREVGGGVQSTT
ncbi:MAG TPA: flavodoxin domain-containing protein [Gaiellaceae bacterium]|nr:flavodoxin domain-containing protein [Gaiellaceae bacterium]